MKIELKTPSARAILNLAPTWGGIMPALILALENGTCEGRAIAREELTRLAAEVDKANENARAGGRELADKFAKYARENMADGNNARTPAGLSLCHARASAFYIAARDAGPHDDGAGYTGKASELYESALAARNDADATAQRMAENLATLSRYGFELTTRADFTARAPTQSERIGERRGAWAIFDSAEGMGGDADGFAIVGDCPAELARAARAHVSP